MVKKPNNIKAFQKEIKGKKIEKIYRRGKNIIFQLSGNKTLLIHQKISGHLLFGKWEKSGKGWQAFPGPLSDRVNSFIHMVFVFDNGKMMALSDPRKFAKTELWNTDEFLKSDFMQKIGPKPLDESFTFDKFKKILLSKKGKIKQVLMDQNVIAGIGNIYSDEILFQAKVYPLRRSNELKDGELKKMYSATKSILKKAIDLKGDSFSDYRTITGEKGEFQNSNKVYQRDGQKCVVCKSIIQKVRIGGRTAHYCPHCQK